MKITKVEYLKVPQEVITRCHSMLTPQEVDRLDSFEENEICLEDGQLENPMIGIFSEECLDYIDYLYNKYGIEYKVTDITDECTHSASAFEKFLTKYSSKKEDIENYIFSNTTINDVLDKINKFGIISLTEIDKQILNK
jgi:hypothetical protein